MEKFVRDPDEAKFVKSYDDSKYKKPSLTADIAIFAEEEGALSLLLIRRKNHPYRGFFALPGGFSEEKESLEQTAERELFEETGVRGVPLEQLRTFSTPGRDPRGWVVTGAYIAIVKKEDITVQAGDDAKEARWFSVDLTEEDAGVTGDGRKMTRCGLTLADGDAVLTVLAKVWYPFEGALPRIEVSESEGLAFDHPEAVLTAVLAAKRRT